MTMTGLGLGLTDGLGLTEGLGVTEGLGLTDGLGLVGVGVSGRHCQYHSCCSREKTTASLVNGNCA